MKRKTAKELLAESFWELATEKPIDRITVGDITRNCGYSTATFYRHFKDKYDLIVWAYTQTVADTMNQIGVDGYSWKQTLLEGAKLFMENRNVLASRTRAVLLLHPSPSHRGADPAQAHAQSTQVARMGEEREQEKLKPWRLREHMNRCCWKISSVSRCTPAPRKWRAGTEGLWSPWA